LESTEPLTRAAAAEPWTAAHRRRRDPGDDAAGPAAEPERRVFTDYVRALTARDGQERAEALLPEVWAALRAAAVSELRRRGLWEVPPVYLGFAGWPAWQSAGGDGALDELVGACYEASFVTRLAGLARQLEVKDNVDGLVFLNIRHLLHTLQLRHDPVGARVFEVLRVAVRSLLDEGAARIVAGSPEVLNDTELALAPARAAGAPTGAERAAARLEAPDLEAEVAAWSDELLPGLLTARGEGERDEIAAALAGRIRGLPAAGVATVRVRDLIEPLRGAVRARWAAVLALSEERVGIDPAAAAGSGGRDAEFGGLARGYRPDLRAEAWDSFVKLTDCVARSVADLRLRPATAAYLDRLWQYLRLYSVHSGEELPSRRALAGLLEIPRNRLPGLYRVLGRLVEACREATAAGRPVTGLEKRYIAELEGAT
jgi:hypothetical protein